MSLPGNKDKEGQMNSSHLCGFGAKIGTVNAESLQFQKRTCYWKKATSGIVPNDIVGFQMGSTLVPNGFQIVCFDSSGSQSKARLPLCQTGQGSAHWEGQQRIDLKVISKTECNMLQ